MSRFLPFMGVVSALLFIALSILSKGWIEPVDHTIFDARLGGYSVAQARDLLAALNEGQRDLYLGAFRVLDTLFPVLLAATLGGVIWSQARGMPTVVRALIALTPGVYLMMDLSENAAVAHLLKNGAQVSAGAVLQASAYTVAKWISLALAMMLTVWAWRLAPKERPAL